jgi:hypothetical protein
VCRIRFRPEWNVTAVKPDTVTIKMQDGKSEMVMLEKTTTYTKDNKPAKSTDLKVGDSVMIKRQNGYKDENVHCR